MNSFELNKIAGAILFTLLVYLGIQNLATQLFKPKPASKNAFIIDVADERADLSNEPEEQQKQKEPSLYALLQTANQERGQKIAKKCVACHNFTENAPHKIGPNLWDILMKDKGKKAGFRYSKSLLAKGGQWNYNALNQFLENPKKYIKGTNMVFIGLRKPQDRADLIAYLRSLSPAPAPLPEDETNKPQTIAE